MTQINILHSLRKVGEYTKSELERKPFHTSNLYEKINDELKRNSYAFKLVIEYTVGQRNNKVNTFTQIPTIEISPYKEPELIYIREQEADEIRRVNEVFNTTRDHPLTIIFSNDFPILQEQNSYFDIYRKPGINFYFKTIEKTYPATL